MKTENYILQYMQQHNISIERMELDTGINMEKMVSTGKDLSATDFFDVCVYLGIEPDEIRDTIL